jgi:uncharacterized protein (TIGR03000 family)
MTRRFLFLATAALGVVLLQTRTSSAQFAWGLPAGMMSPFQGGMWYWPGGVPATFQQRTWPYGLFPAGAAGGAVMSGGMGYYGLGGYGLGGYPMGGAYTYGLPAARGAGLAAAMQSHEAGYWPPSPYDVHGQPINLPTDLVYEATSLPASIRVNAPADAVLLFDGQATSQTGPTRVFTTPPLEKGKNYHYDLIARFSKGGSPTEVKKRVDVYSGANVQVSFDE